MTLRSVANPHPYIACILAAGEAQDRMRAAEPPPPPSQPWTAPCLDDLTNPERSEARLLAYKYRYTISEAADIVRRSRR